MTWSFAVRWRAFASGCRLQFVPRLPSLVERDSRSLPRGQSAGASRRSIARTVHIHDIEAEPEAEFA